MCLILFYFILIVSLAKRKWIWNERPVWIFFVKNTKHGGDHCKKTLKKVVIFVIGIEKNKSTPLFKGQIYLKIGD